MAGIILEGIVAAGKTTIRKLLPQQKRISRRQSIVSIGEQLTERAIEHVESKSPEDSLGLLDKVLSSAEILRNLYIESKFHPGDRSVDPFFIFDRFHLTHCVSFVHSFESFESVEVRLRNLGIKLVLLLMDRTVTPERIHNTRKHRHPGWSRYLNTLGKSSGEIGDHFVRRQEQYLRAYDDSCLEKICLDTSGEDWEDLARTIDEKLYGHSVRTESKDQ